MKHIQLTLTGDPGTGKTTVLAQIKTFLKRKGYTVHQSPLDSEHEIRIAIP